MSYSKSRFRHHRLSSPGIFLMSIAAKLKMVLKNDKFVRDVKIWLIFSKNFSWKLHALRLQCNCESIWLQFFFVFFNVWSKRFYFSLWGFVVHWNYIWKYFEVVGKLKICSLIKIFINWLNFNSYFFGKAYSNSLMPNVKKWSNTLLNLAVSPKYSWPFFKTMHGRI